MASAAVKIGQTMTGERAAARRIVRVDARMRPLGAAGGAVQVHNISTQGFMIEADEAFDIDSYVWLTLPGHPRLSARIVWRDAFRYGCTFTTPIDAATVAALANETNAN